VFNSASEIRMPRLTQFIVPALFAGLLAVAVASPASAEESCHVTGTMMSRDAITQSLHARGYTKIRGLSTHNGCWEAKGLDSKGRRFELELNGATGVVMNKE
jgi:hypothetical protein